MKFQKHIFSVLFLFAICGNLYAQGISFQLSSSHTAIGIPGDELVVYGTITNNYSVPVDVDAVRIENNLATGWLSSLCLDNCLPPHIDSGRTQINANSTQQFTFHFYTDLNPDSGNAKMTFRNAANPSEFIEQVFYGITDSSLSVETYADSKNFRVVIYPNPVIHEAVCRIEGNNQPPYSFLVMDLLGNTVIRRDNIFNSEIQFDRRNISNGLYIYIVSDREGNSRQSTVNFR